MNSINITRCLKEFQASQLSEEKGVKAAAKMSVSSTSTTASLTCPFFSSPDDFAIKFGNRPYFVVS